MKKILFILVFLLPSLLANAYDAEIDGIYYNFNGDEAEVTFNNKNPYYNNYAYSGTVLIPTSVAYNDKSYKVTSIGYNAFSGCSRMTTINIPNSVASIGNYAFEDCTGLTSITIPNSVTSIGNRVFYCCSGLTSVTIGNSVISIGDCAFYYCSGLASITIPNSVTSIGNRAFYYCHGLSSITIPKSVNNIGINPFDGCRGLTSIIVEVGNTKYDSRNNCNAIIETVTNTLIAGCQNTVIPNSVTSIGNAAFEECFLTSITIPNSVTSIGESAFNGCSGLTSINIPESVTNIGDGAFCCCSGLISITIPNSVTSIGNSAFEDCSGLTSVTIPNSVTSIGNAAFRDCRGLTSVTIPNSVTSISSQTFYGCSGLTSVTIPNSVTSIGYDAFSRCSSLTSITIPNSVTSIESKAFSLCSVYSSYLGRYIGGLESITIGSGVTSIGFDAFEHCDGLKKVIVPDLAAWCGISFLDNPLYYAHHLYSSELTEITDLVIPNSVTSIGEIAFSGCSGLTSINIPNSVTSIGKSAFSGCSGLKKVVVPDIAAWYGISFGNEYANPLYYAHHLYSDEETEITDLVIPDGMTRINPNAFYGCRGLTSITIPNSLTSIGNSAFYGCKGLTFVTSYAMEPPTLGSYTFKGVPEGLEVYVLPAAIPQYLEAAGWKDYRLLPIGADRQSIIVSLPEGSNAQDYAQMWLELVNTKRDQRLHYVITDRTQYTFSNIDKNSTWNVVLRNERGDVFGQIDNIKVKDEDVSVTFSSLSKPQSVVLSVLTPEGQDVTSQTQISWTDAQGNYIAQAASLSGLPVGYQANYSIVLSQELAMTYSPPLAAEYTLMDGDNNITCQLDSIKQVQISGKVKDAETGLPLSGAVISVSQTFGGKHTKTLTAKTGKNGVFTIEVSNVPTSLTFVATDYVSRTINYDNGLDDLDGYVVPDVSLKTIAGATITLDFTYTTVEGETQDWYSDYNNVGYSIYNETKDCAISQFNVQYPQIVLLEEVEDGDELRLIASSRTNTFKPVESKATIAEQKAEASFAIKELGRIQAMFTTSGNASVVGSLYDASGKLVKTYNYSNALLTISGLVDGQYTLVSMGSSQLYNTIYDLAQLPQTGLAEGADYVKNTVMVKSGAISTIRIDEVPTLDESKLYYTGNNTSFTVNKPSIVVGNYIALTGHIDFKPDYASNVSNVQMIVDLPETCQFVDNSVMVGNSISSYILDGNRITIPMTNYTDRVLFCVIPTVGGDYAPSAFAQFNLNGKTVTQPIGSANYTAKDLSISVSSPVAKTNIPVSGTAIGTSNIEIYDNGVLIGQTTSLANGTWATTCELNEPYNLSTHSLYAKVTTKQGIELQSETKDLTYDMNAIQIQKVTMYHYNPEMHTTFESVFDFQNPHTTPNQWAVYYPSKKFTYTVDFTNNSPEKVSNVILYVHAADGQIVPLYPTYDEKKDTWVADIDMGNRSDNYYPVNVSVDFDAVTSIIGDRSEISEKQEFLSEIINEAKTERDNLISEYNGIEEDDDDSKTLQSLLANENADEDEINRLFDIILGGGSSSAPTIILTDEEIESLEIEADKKISEWDDVHDSALLNQLLEDCFDDPSFDYGDEMSFSIPTDEGIKSCKKEIMKDIDEERMTTEGYTKVELTDGSSLYYLFSDNSVIIVDVLKKEKYSIDITETANSSSRYESRRVNIVGYLTCGKNAINTIKDVCGKVQSSSDNRRRMAEIAAGLLAVKNDLACYYDGLYTDLILNIKRAYDVADSIINADKKVYSDLKGVCEYKLNEIRKNIADLEKINNSYKHDLYILNGKESLTDAEKAMKANLESMLKEQEKTLRELKQDRQKWYNKTKKYEKQLEKLTKKGNILTKHYIKIKNTIVGKLPAKLTKFAKLPTTVKVCGKIAGTCGIAIQIIGLYTSVTDIGEDAKEWLKVMDMIDAKLPCDPDGDPLKEAIYNNAAWHIGQNFASLASDAAGVVISAAGGVPGSPTWWIDMAVNVLLTPSRIFNGHASERDRNNYIGEILSLKCEKDCGQPGMPPCPDPNPNPNPGGNGSGSSNDDVQIDPSGFVYEGVPSNRLQGVTATAYYKEMVEDMYGEQHENIVKWDASEYAQENPLFTDEYGMYRWDVPQGLWQVKFEKEGYETTYSEWLPVPPPQLDVNIAMKQARQPEVKDAHAYEDGVEVEFDKYMLPELLTTENIKVMAPSNSPEGVEIAVEGIIELINEETSYEDENVKFASRVRFVPETPFTAKQVTLVVANSVKSYADIPMQDTYTQTLDIEKEVKEIVVDSLVKVPYQGAGTITIHVLPADAAAGRTLTIKNSSSMILGVETEEVIIDEDGKAEVTLSGELPGTAALTFSVEGTDKTAVTIINVELIKPVATPTASIVSGSIVKKGTQIELFCATEGATIYYTLDGSCPCVNSEARKVYDGTPITIEKNTVIKAMASAPDMEESKIATFVYIVTNGDLNGDGKVDIADGVVVLNTMAEGKYDDFVDVNHDLTVDIADFVTILNIMAQLSVLHEYVDLGLPSGTLWATCNVGANSPEEYGDYFAWGETTGYNSGKTDFKWDTYKYCNDSTETLTKYCMSSSDGTVDNKTELEPEDDAATANWGSRWQMPSKEQCEELINSNNTTTEWTSLNGKYGKKITSKINGKSIFLPTAGAFVDTIINYGESEGGLWSRSLDTNNSNFAYYLYFSPTDIYITKYCFRCVGLSVRPVRVDSVEQ